MFALFICYNIAFGFQWSCKSSLSSQADVIDQRKSRVGLAAFVLFRGVFCMLFLCHSIHILLVKISANCCFGKSTSLMMKLVAM